MTLTTWPLKKIKFTIHIILKASFNVPWLLCYLIISVYNYEFFKVSEFEFRDRFCDDSKFFQSVGNLFVYFFAVFTPISFVVDVSLPVWVVEGCHFSLKSVPVPPPFPDWPVLMFPHSSFNDETVGYDDHPR